MSINPLARIDEHLRRLEQNPEYAPRLCIDNFQDLEIEKYECTEETANKIVEYIFTHFSGNVVMYREGFLHVDHLNCFYGD